MSKDTKRVPKSQEEKYRSAYLGDRCYGHLFPILRQLKTQLDRRLVETFLGLVDSPPIQPTPTPDPELAPGTAPATAAP